MSTLSDHQRLVLLAKSHQLQLSGVDYQQAANDTVSDLLPIGVTKVDFSGDEWDELGRYLEQSPDADCQCKTCLSHDWAADHGERLPQRT